MFHSYVSHCEVPPNWSAFMHIFLASLWRYGLSGIKNIRCCMLLLHDWSVWYALCHLWLESSFTYCLMEVTPQLIFNDQWLKQWERDIFKNTRSEMCFISIGTWWTLSLRGLRLECQGRIWWLRKITIQTSPGIGDLEKHHQSIYLQHSAGSNPAEFSLNQTVESIEMS